MESGNMELHVMSISWSNCDNDLFHEIWLKAICPEAGSILGIDPDYLSKHYKDVFEHFGHPTKGYCESCYDHKATQRHHKFPNTVPNNRTYGAGNPFDGIDWINDARNIQNTCEACNVSHAGHGSGLKVWSERKFCEVLGIEQRSKSKKVGNYI